MKISLLINMKMPPIVGGFVSYLLAETISYSAELSMKKKVYVLGALTPYMSEHFNNKKYIKVAVGNKEYIKE